MKECDLVLQSGGLDSTYMLYKILKDGHLNVHVHHVNMINYEHRDKAEYIAIQNNIKELRKIRNFKFTITSVDVSCFKKRLYDYTQTLLMGFHVGISLKNYDMVYINVGLINHEVHIENCNDTKYILKRYKERDMWSVLTRDSKVHQELKQPLSELTKKDIYYNLPENIRKNCQYCRKPLYINNKYVPCNQCHTCLEVNSIVSK